MMPSPTDQDYKSASDDSGIMERVKAGLSGALVAYRTGLTKTEGWMAVEDVGGRRELALAHERLGDLLIAQGQWTAAREEFRAATAIMERLAAEDPKNPAWQRRVAESQRKLASVITAR